MRLAIIALLLAGTAAPAIAQSDNAIPSRVDKLDRPDRLVNYIDLTRIQPVSARVGYAKIAKNKHTEKSAMPFGADQVHRLSAVIGRDYDSARMALSSIDDKREVPVISKHGMAYSGFHQGSGETSCTLSVYLSGAEMPTRAAAFSRSCPPLNVRNLTTRPSIRLAPWTRRLCCGWLASSLRTEAQRPGACRRAGH